MGHRLARHSPTAHHISLREIQKLALGERPKHPGLIKHIAFYSQKTHGITKTIDLIYDKEGRLGCALTTLNGMVSIFQIKVTHGGWNGMTVIAMSLFSCALIMSRKSGITLRSTGRT